MLFANSIDLNAGPAVNYLKIGYYQLNTMILGVISPIFKKSLNIPFVIYKNYTKFVS
jgi:hypothetical protein